MTTKTHGTPWGHRIAIVLGILLVLAGLILGILGEGDEVVAPTPTADKVDSDRVDPKSLILPIEELVKCNQWGGKSTKKEIEDQLKYAVPLADKSNSRVYPKGTVIDIKDAWDIYLKDGPGGNYGEKVTLVNFSNMLDTVISLKRFKGIASRFKNAGRSMPDDYIVKAGDLLDECKRPVLLPKFYWEGLKAAADKAGVVPEIDYGLRPTELQAIMHVRTVQASCMFGMLNSICADKVARETASRPKNRGLQHFYSADIPNYPEFEEELGESDIAIGCNGLGSKDMLHGTMDRPRKLIPGCGTKAAIKKGGKKLKNKLKKWLTH